jgi:hypothetical protein
MGLLCFVRLRCLFILLYYQLAKEIQIFLVSLFVVKKYDFGQDSSLTKWKFRRGRLDAIVRIILVLILHYKTCFNSIWLVAPPVQDTLAYG